MKYLLLMVIVTVMVCVGCSNGSSGGLDGGTTDTDTDTDSDSDTETDTDVDTDDWGDAHGYIQECWDTGGGPSCGAKHNAEVVAMDEDSDSFGPAISDTDGNYMLPLPPGTYDIEATDPDDMCAAVGASGLVIGVNESVKQDFTMWADVDAPYVYLYPTTAMQIDVTLTPAAGMSITESEPEYGDGWSVWAEPSGLLDGEHDFLFYESTVLWLFQDEQGWAVPAENIFAWFEEQLPVMGLNDDETTDFLDYWTVHLPYAPCYRVFPQPIEIIEQEMELLVEPEPDNLLRLWLMIEGAAECDLVATPVVEPFERVGFTVVEWGVALNGPTF